MQGNPMAGKMKNFLRGLAVVTVPLTASFPKVRTLPYTTIVMVYVPHSCLMVSSRCCAQALFCYWLTSNIFSMIQAGLLKDPRLKNAFDIPDTSQVEQSKVHGNPPVTFSEPPKQAKTPSKPAAPAITFSQPPKHAKGDAVNRAQRRKH
eukprot:TRINITY_DN3275_c0_g1_i1.p1 TRINITY_DN3275_c0_g1~~TRINITY_DN3275_c0_g1_i1.p1  ORF type:complete len:149 (-),score=12.36 TRINITY_DN3275_c0_g1_i1:68-514(-)